MSDETSISPHHAVYLTQLFAYMAILNNTEATEEEALEDARRIASLFIRYINSELPLDLFIWSLGIDTPIEQINRFLFRDEETESEHDLDEEE